MIWGQYTLDLRVPRVFIALPVADEVRSRLAAAQRLLASGGDLPVRWSRPSGLHLTLVFVGELPDADLPGLHTAMATGCAGHRAVSLETSGVGAFPDLRRPRVLWAGVEGELAPLRALQESLAGALRQAGVPVDGRPYRPHVTLGRIAGRTPSGSLDRLQETVSGLRGADWGRWEAGETRLMRSDAAPGGAVYTTLSAVPLAPRDCGAP